MKVLKAIIKREKERVRVNLHREKLKHKYVDYLGGKCIECGYHKNIKAFDFHHKSPENKKFEISSAIKRKRKWVDVKDELDKCILLCANCHREIHS